MTRIGGRSVRSNQCQHCARDLPPDRAGWLAVYGEYGDALPPMWLCPDAVLVFRSALEMMRGLFSESWLDVDWNEQLRSLVRPLEPPLKPKRVRLRWKRTDAKTWEADCPSLFTVRVSGGAVTWIRHGGPEMYGAAGFTPEGAMEHAERSMTDMLAVLLRDPVLAEVKP